MGQKAVGAACTQDPAQGTGQSTWPAPQACGPEPPHPSAPGLAPGERALSSALTHPFSSPDPTSQDSPLSICREDSQPHGQRSVVPTSPLLDWWNHLT